jgi:hypothetical protein
MLPFRNGVEKKIVNCKLQTGRFANGKQRCRADVKHYITPQGVMVIVVVKYVEYSLCIANILI